MKAIHNADKGSQHFTRAFHLVIKARHTVSKQIRSGSASVNDARLHGTVPTLVSELWVIPNQSIIEAEQF